MIELGSLTQPLTRVRRRLRWQRALDTACWAAVAALVWAAVAHLAQRLGQLGGLSWTLWPCVGAPLLAAALGALWPVQMQRAAQCIDHSHTLHDRVRSALEFARSDQPTAFMRAAVRDALERSASISPRRAAPVHAPRALRYGVPAVLAVAFAWLMPLPSPETLGSGGAPAALPPRTSLDPETTRAFAAEARALVTPHSEQTRAWVERYEAILEKLGSGALTMEQALEELQALQRRIQATREGASAVLSEGLRRLARALSSESVTSALARALERGDLDAAASALEELSKRVSTRSMPRTQQETLRRALERAAERRAETDPHEPELLKRDRSPTGQPTAEPQLLKQRRELERLERETSQAAREESKRKLEQLRRDLAEATSRDAETAGKALGDAAQQTRDLAQSQADREQQRRLSEQLEQLRQELERQQRAQDQRGPGAGQSEEDPSSSDAQGQAERMQQFRLRARGPQDPPPEADDAGMSVVLPKPEGEPRDGGQPEAGPTAGTRADGGADARGGKPRRALQLGGDGPPTATLQMPGSFERGASSQHSDQSDFSEQSRDPRLRGQTRDSQVEGIAGRGPSRSEVIVGAADRGFASSPYRDVYTDYRAHAEDVLDRDEIPPGYRFYVRQYFQLIRPREEGNTP